jgi:hypothetical protein
LSAGAGVETHWRGIRIAPTVRYTRWAEDNQRFTNGRTAPNQVELFVAFSREAESSWRPFGDRVSLGVVLGTNVTGDYRTTRQQYTPSDSSQNITVLQSSGPRSFIVGPTLRVGLSQNFSVSVDALSRPVSSSSEIIFADGARQSGSGSFHTWEFPVLATYKFRVHRVQPFVGAGPSFRIRGSLGETSWYGATAAAGVQARLSRLQIEPQFRYTYWRPDRFPQFRHVQRNQTEVLAAFTF